jgi:hypothetical protein
MELRVGRSNLKINMEQTRNFQDSTARNFGISASVKGYSVRAFFFFFFFFFFAFLLSMFHSPNAASAGTAARAPRQSEIHGTPTVAK